MPRTREHSRRVRVAVPVALALGLSILAAAPPAPPAGAAPVPVAPAAPAPVPAAAHPDLRTDVLDLAPGAAPRASLRANLLLAASAQAAAADDPGHHAGPVQLLSQEGLEPFVALGFSWAGPAGGVARAFITQADGQVLGPVELANDSEHGEDTRGPSARRVTEPIALTAPAVAFEVTVPADATDVRAHFVRGDAAAAPFDAPLQRATADGIPGPEGIRPRESWNPRPRRQSEPCAPGARYEGLGCVATGGVVNAVVHHTVNANNYSADSVPALIRSIQAFHQDAQDFDDIGYNFIVDRFGGIWEARVGGVDRPVVGGHTMGFNTGSVGVAVLGTFDGAAPSEAALDAVARIIAWKFAQRNVDPLGQVTVISNGGDIHDKGVAVTVNTIDGHRSLGATGCPGALLFARLGDIRARAAAQIPLVTGELTGLDRGAGRVRLSGYALRRDVASPMAITVAIDGRPVSQTVANLPRLDVVLRFPTIGAAHGFDVTVPVDASMRRICVTENLSGTLVGCRDVNPVSPPFGDFGVVTSLVPPRIGVSGWAADADTSDTVVTHVYLDGRLVAEPWAERARPDVAAAYPELGPNRGFAVDLATTPGLHQLCVYAINTPPGDHALLGCREVAVGPVNRFAPAGSLDVVQPGGASVLVSGWALDRDTNDPLNVHVYVDDLFVPLVTSVPRPDVAAVFPGVTGRSGFSARIAVAPGRRIVCVFAIDANLVGPHAGLGCRVVEVLAPNAAPPTGSLDVVRTAPGTVSVAGWTIDPDTADPIQVHVYVGRTGSGHAASVRRDDIGAVFPAFGPNHGFAVDVPAPRGAQQVCVYGINNLAGAANTLLGCRTVTVP